MKTFVKEHPIAAFMALLTLCLLPAILLRAPSPSNELRYLSIADEALRDGHFFALYNQGEAYSDKPPLFFWVIMLCRTMFGSHVLWVLYIVLALIPSFCLIAVMDRWLRMAVSEVTTVERLCCATLLATGFLFMGMSIFLRMDTLMALFITLSLYTFWKLVTNNGTPHDIWLLPVYVFLALFTKGPVGFFAPVLTIAVYLAWSRDWKGFGKYLGLRFWGVLALLFAVWIAASWAEGGKEYIQSLLFHQTIDRAVDAFHHKQPFWYYMTTIWYVIAPYSLMVVPGVVLMFFRKGHFSPYRRLLLAGTGTVFVMLSCFSSKLAIYLTPIFPFMAYLMPLAEDERKGGCNGLAKASILIPASLFAMAGAALALLPMLVNGPLGQYAATIVGEAPYLVHLPVTIAGVLLCAGSVVAGIVTVRKGWMKGAVAVGLAMAVCAFSLSFSMKEINRWTAYEDVTREAMRPVASSNAPSAFNTLYVSRPENMDVYFGCDVTNFGTDYARFLRSPHDGEVLIIKTGSIKKAPLLEEYLRGKYGIQIGNMSVYHL